MSTRVVVEEPDGLVLKVGRDWHGLDSYRSAVHCVSEARIETVDGDVCVVDGLTWAAKRRLGDGVVALCDCRKTMVSESKGQYQAKTYS